MSNRKIALYSIILFGVVVFVCFSLFILFPGIYLNKFIKNTTINSFEKQNPDYLMVIGEVQCHVFKNVLEFDSVSIKSKDRKFKCDVAKISIKDIDRIRAIFFRSDLMKIIQNSKFNSKQLVFSYDKYILKCKQLVISIPDSSIIADGLHYCPKSDDKQFFADNKYKITRYNLNISKCKLSGADFAGFIKDKNYKLRSMMVNDVYADIMLNRDKESEKNTPNPIMLNEMLFNVKKVLKVDNIKITNGYLIYNEQVTLNSKPGVLTFDNLNISVLGFTNKSIYNSNIAIHVDGKFMNSCMMKINITLPVATPDLTLKFSGSLGKMNVDELNKFLVISENVRIKTGKLNKASFDITVKKGHSTGNVNAEYKDLFLAFLSPKTGSESGFLNKSETILANLMKLNGTNTLEKGSKFKIGEVNYTRKPEETFIQFVWSSLRSGVSDVVGF